jgi:hypothetical protein
VVAIWDYKRFLHLVFFFAVVPVVVAIWDYKSFLQAG